jgi:hypothetical protein
MIESILYLPMLSRMMLDFKALIITNRGYKRDGVLLGPSRDTISR